MTGTGMIFGEVLFDCFPDGREVPGGAPFNVAWNLRALGMHPLFISRVGSDILGAKIIEYMNSWSMTTSYLQVDPSAGTGRVMVTLRNGEPQFDILADQAYDHITVSDLPVISEPIAFLYHGSLALRNRENRNTLAQIKELYPCPLFLDVNLRDPWWNREHIISLLEEATWLKLNEDELAAVFPGRTDIAAGGKMLLDRFNLQTVFITRGRKGAVAVTGENEVVTVAPADSIDVVDTVGAGDAFSSVLLTGLVRNWPMQVIMKRAQDFASGIVSLRGATTLDRNFYTSYSRKWNLS